MKEIRLSFGIFADPIEKQVGKEGYQFKNEETLKRYENLIDAWNWIRIHGIATDAEVDKMANRLIKKMTKDLVPLQKEIEEL